MDNVIEGIISGIYDSDLDAESRAELRDKLIGKLKATPQETNEVFDFWLSNLQERDCANALREALATAPKDRILDLITSRLTVLQAEQNKKQLQISELERLLHQVSSNGNRIIRKDN